MTPAGELIRSAAGRCRPMAFLKLLPPEGGDALPVPDIIRRLEDEFTEVHTAPMRDKIMWLA